MANSQSELKKLLAMLRRADKKPIIDMTRPLYPEVKELIRALARRDVQRAVGEQPEELGD